MRFHVFIFHSFWNLNNTKQEICMVKYPASNNNILFVNGWLLILDGSLTPFRATYANNSFYISADCFFNLCLNKKELSLPNNFEIFYAYQCHKWRSRCRCSGLLISNASLKSFSAINFTSVMLILFRINGFPKLIANLICSKYSI